jgi:hypothetical protein
MGHPWLSWGAGVSGPRFVELLEVDIGAVARRQRRTLLDHERGWAALRFPEAADEPNGISARAPTRAGGAWDSERRVRSGGAGQPRDRRAHRVRSRREPSAWLARWARAQRRQRIGTHRQRFASSFRGARARTRAALRPAHETSAPSAEAIAELGRPAVRPLGTPGPGVPRIHEGNGVGLAIRGRHRWAGETAPAHAAAQSRPSPSHPPTRRSLLLCAASHQMSA